MQNNLAKNLEQLGLNTKESLVYIALLETNRASIAGISIKTGIKRPTCYLVVDELIKKGLVTSIPIGRKTLYSAEHPTKIIKNIEKNLSTAKNIVSGLQEIMMKQSDKPVLRVINGKKGVQLFYEEMLEDKNDIYYIASIKDVAESVGEDFLNDWVKKRIGLGIKTFSIRTKTTDINHDLYRGDSKNLREVVYADQTFDPDFMIFIYGKKVAFIGKNGDDLGFIVSSINLSKTMKSMFDVTWKALIKNE